MIEFKTKNYFNDLLKISEGSKFRTKSNFTNYNFGMKQVTHSKSPKINPESMMRLKYPHKNKINSKISDSVSISNNITQQMEKTENFLKDSDRSRNTIIIDFNRYNNIKNELDNKYNSFYTTALRDVSKNKSPNSTEIFKSIELKEKQIKRYDKFFTSMINKSKGKVTNLPKIEIKRKDFNPLQKLRTNKINTMRSYLSNSIDEVITFSNLLDNMFEKLNKDISSTLLNK
jgi:hemerythrin-like domain-containing protein